MNNNLFYVVTGKHGATYILNLKNCKSVKSSLSFYKTTSFKSSILIFIFRVFLFFKFFFKSYLKTASEINSFLKKISKKEIDFDINNSCSVLIAPTNDKIIVNHHDKFFQKFAFGASYTKVCKEAQYTNYLKKVI